MDDEAAESGARGGDAAASDDPPRHAGAAGGAAGVAGEGAGGVDRHVEKRADGAPMLAFDDPFDRAWRRVGLALDRVGFTVVDRDRATARTSSAMPIPMPTWRRRIASKGSSRSCAFWKTDDKDKPEQYRIKVVETAPASTVSVQDPSRQARPYAGQRARSSRCCATSSSSGRQSRHRTMRFASLGSGSEGNGLIVEVGARILVDCGFAVAKPSLDSAAGASSPNRSARSSSRTSTPITSVAWRRSPRASGIPCGSPLARWTTGERSMHRSRVRLRQSRSVRDRPAGGPADPGAARCTRAGPVCVGDGVHRLGVLTDIGVTTRFVEQPERLRRAGARMQP